MKSLFSLQNLLYTALVLALLSSLEHVAFAFATTNGNNWYEAYISAVAIDLGLLALAAGINKRKTENRSTKTLWGGVILFSVISTYANWLAGIAHVVAIDVSLDTMAGQANGWLVSLRPILLSGVLPILVIYLSEIVSGNYRVDLAEAQKQAKKVSRTTAGEPGSPADAPVHKPPSEQTEAERLANLVQAERTKAQTRAGRREQVSDLLQQEQSQAAIARALGVHPSTIKRDIKALNGAANNGSGHN